MCTSIGEGWDNDSIQSINNTIQWGHSTRYRYNKPPWNNGRFRYDISYDITDTDMISVMISQIQIWYQLWYHRYRYIKPPWNNGRFRYDISYDITDTDMILQIQIWYQLWYHRYRYDISYDITDTDMISVMISQIQIWYYRYRYVRGSQIGVLCYLIPMPGGRLHNTSSWLL